MTPIDNSVWRMTGDPLVAGAPDGPLRGLRVAVKDLFAVAGHRIGAGNPTRLAGAPVEPAHAPAVAVLLEAGADVVGIAQTDEFAYSLAGANVHYGTPPNPAVPDGLPGGSSNGSGAAVALGQADIGLGTDTAGSIRIPASYQGLWGLRTTHGAVDRTGVHPLGESFDTVGWLTRDADTLRRVVEVCLPGAAEPDGPLLVPNEALADLESGTRTAFEELLGAWRAAGRDVRSVSLGDPGELVHTLVPVQAAEAWRAHGAWVGAHPGALGDAVAGRFAAASRITSGELDAARARLAALRTRVRGVVGGGALVLPAAPGPAPARDADPTVIERVRSAILRLTSPAGVAGLPSVCAPLLRTDRGPVGVCLVGPAGSDPALVRLPAELAG